MSPSGHNVKGDQKQNSSCLYNFKPADIQYAHLKRIAKENMLILKIVTLKHVWIALNQKQEPKQVLSETLLS